MSLLPNEVKTEHIANRAVTNPKIADEAVTARKLDERAVTTEKLATNAVTGSKLAANAVTGSKIRDGTVRAEKIAAGAITTAKIGAQQVIGSRIKDNTVTSEKLANNAVTTRKIADRSVTKSKLSFELPEPGEGGVTRPLTPPVATDEIADASVTADKLATDSVTQTKIARNTVGWSEIRTQSLEPEQIKTLSGLPPTPGQVPVYDESEGNEWWFRWADAATRPLSPQVATEEIADGAVTAEKLDPAISLGGDRFVFGTLDTPGLQSADVMYLPDITADIPYTVLDLSPWIPANAKGVLLQIGIFNQAYSTGRAFFRVRTNEEQRDALGLGNMVGSNSQMANQGIVPLVVGTDPRTIEYALESVGGPWIATFTLWVTVVGYIM